MTQQPVDLSTCDEEPIHIPGYTQPHGLLLALHEPTLTITQVSSNVAALTGKQPEQLLGQPLNTLLDADQEHYLEQMLATEQLDANPLYLWTVPLGADKISCDGMLHRYNGVLILEFEPAPPKPARLPDMYRHVKSTIARLQQAATFHAFCQGAADEIRALTGFDRVMIYQFAVDGSGTVVAEALAHGLQPYLGLHYPASDIPRQARALYVQNWLRLIADVNAVPAQLVPTLNPHTQQPLDMSYAVLRSVSPIHIEYLQHMGVGASMSISLVQDGELWGLIACHHMSAKVVSYEIRTACEFLAQAMSLQLVNKLHGDDQSYAQAMEARLQVLSNAMLSTKDWATGLLMHPAQLQHYFEAEGVAVIADNSCTTLGTTPAEADIRRLVEWLVEHSTQPVYATHGLPHEFEEWQAMRQVASGILALAVAPELREYVIWFRPEIAKVVYWAGEPTKPVEVTEGGTRLSPRRSFEKWKQEVEGESQRWKRVELQGALNLRRAILEALVYRAGELLRENIALEQSNSELDAFAYVASHDLKEPLRGLYNYASFLIEDYHDQLDEAGQHKLQTLLRLSQRMEALIESLLHYSRVGRTEIRLREVDLNLVLRELQSLLLPRLQEEQVELVVPRPLPTVQAHETQISEVLSNLLSNAIKYNLSQHKQIRLTWDRVADMTLPETVQPGINGILMRVTDNGIGLAEQHQAVIFRIFKRLHGRDEYGGGTGAGLTIVKKIIERHGGSIWVESRLGEGTTFLFTI